MREGEAQSIGTSDVERSNLTVRTFMRRFARLSLGFVFASPSTWYRLIRIHNWRRPRKRIHPAKPKVGIRASHPNEIWHVAWCRVLKHQ